MSEEFNCENTIKSLRSTLAPDSIAVEAPTEEEIQQYILGQGDPIELESIELMLLGNPVLWQQVQEMIEDHNAEQPFQWEPLPQEKPAVVTSAKPSWLTLYRAPISLVLGTAACALFAVIAIKSGMFSGNHQTNRPADTVAVRDPKPNVNTAPPSIDPNHSLTDKKLPPTTPIDPGTTTIPIPNRPFRENNNLVPNPAVNNNGAEGTQRPIATSTDHQSVRPTPDNRSTVPTPPVPPVNDTTDPPVTVVASGRIPRATLPTVASITTDSATNITRYVSENHFSGSAGKVTIDQAAMIWIFDPNLTISWQGTDLTDKIKITVAKCDPKTFAVDTSMTQNFEVESASSFTLPTTNSLGPDILVKFMVNKVPVAKWLVIHRYTINEYTQMTNMLAEAPSNFEKARIYAAFHQYDKALSILEGDQSEGAIELTKALQSAKAIYQNPNSIDIDQPTGTNK